MRRKSAGKTSTLGYGVCLKCHLAIQKDVPRIMAPEGKEAVCLDCFTLEVGEKVKNGLIEKLDELLEQREDLMNMDPPTYELQ